MPIRYIGPDRLLSVNGRPLKEGEILTDERECADLAWHHHFEQVGEPDETEVEDLDEE